MKFGRLLGACVLALVSLPALADDWQAGAGPEWQKLLADAKKEIDHDKRKAMIFELQRMTHDDGGAVVPAFKSWVDAAAQKVKNYKPYSLYDLCNTRVAEMVWIDES